MKNQKTIVATAFAAALASQSATAANLLLNGGFEVGGVTADNWEHLGANPPNVTNVRATSDPASGVAHVAMAIDNTSAPTAAGVFIQQITPFGSVSSANTYVLTFDAKVASNDFTGINMFAQILFLDMDGSHGGGVKGETLQSLVSTITDSYQTFTIDNLVPLEGTDGAIIRFQLAAGPIDGIQNTFFVDNASFSVIPEPSAALLGMIGLIGLARRKRA